MNKIIGVNVLAVNNIRYLGLIAFLTVLCACAHLPGSHERVWIDVRTPGEYAAGHLETAANIPHTQITDRIHEVVTDKNTEIHLYCGSGGRAEIARQALLEMGYTNVTNNGGYRDLVGNK